MMKVPSSVHLLSIQPEKGIKALAHTGTEILQLNLNIEEVKTVIVHSNYAINLKTKDWIGLLSNNAQT